MSSQRPASEVSATQMTGFLPSPDSEGSAYGACQFLRDAAGTLSVEFLLGMTLIGVFGYSWVWMFWLGFFGMLVRARASYRDDTAWLLLLWTVPIICMGGAITYSFLDSAGADPQEPYDRICHYLQYKHEFKSFYTIMGWENHVVHYPSFKIKCEAKMEGMWPRFLATQLTAFFPMVMQYAAPYLFMSAVLGAVKSSTGANFNIVMYIFLQLAVLDYLDVMNFLLIGFSPANFVYLASNRIYSLILPGAYVITVVIVVLEVCLSYDLLPALFECFDKSPQTDLSHPLNETSKKEKKEKARTRCAAFLSLCIDLPLAFLRAAFKANGLEISVLFLFKNFVLLVADGALIWYGKPHNRVNTKLMEYLSWLPGASKLKDEVELEQREADRKKADTLMTKMDAFKFATTKMEYEMFATQLFILAYNDSMTADPEIRTKAFRYFKEYDQDDLKHVITFCFTKYEEMLLHGDDKEETAQVTQLKKEAPEKGQKILAKHIRMLMNQKKKEGTDDETYSQLKPELLQPAMVAIGTWLKKKQIPTADQLENEKVDKAEQKRRQSQSATGASGKLAMVSP